MAQTTAPVAAGPVQKGLVARPAGQAHGVDGLQLGRGAMIDGNTFVGWVLGGVDLFLMWWAVVLAIGLAVLYRRRTQPIALALLAVYAVIVVGLAAVMSRGGGA